MQIFVLVVALLFTMPLTTFGAYKDIFPRGERFIKIDGRYFVVTPEMLQFKLIANLFKYSGDEQVINLELPSGLKNQKCGEIFYNVLCHLEQSRQDLRVKNLAVRKYPYALNLVNYLSHPSLEKDIASVIQTSKFFRQPVLRLPDYRQKAINYGSDLHLQTIMDAGQSLPKIFYTFPKKKSYNVMLPDELVDAIKEHHYDKGSIKKVAHDTPITYKENLENVWDTQPLEHKLQHLKLLYEFIEHYDLDTYAETNQESFFYRGTNQQSFFANITNHVNNFVLIGLWGLFNVLPAVTAYIYPWQESAILIPGYLLLIHGVHHKVLERERPSHLYDNVILSFRTQCRSWAPFIEPFYNRWCAWQEKKAWQKTFDYFTDKLRKEYAE